MCKKSYGDRTVPVEIVQRQYEFVKFDIVLPPYGRRRAFVTEALLFEVT